MSRERPRVRADLGVDPTRHDVLRPDTPAVPLAEQGLAGRLAELDPAWQVRPGSVRFPWRRTYEIEVTVEPRN